MEHDSAPLARLLDDLPRGDGGARDAILEAFLEYVASLDMELYPAQEEAVLELLASKHVILSTPTGSGKSLVAVARHFLAMAEGKFSCYTAPTKALVNEKFFDLCDAFGPGNVGMLTGDASVNSEAPIICCTMEILSNWALREDDLEMDYVVMDEFHFYGDRERGVAWQIPLITMKNSLFLLMSATLGDTTTIEKGLSDFTSRPVARVSGTERPVPLEFEYREAALQDTVEDLVTKSEAPIYLVNFTQRDCAEQAQNLTSIKVCPKDEKKQIAEQLIGERFDTPYAKEFRRFVTNGIGIHHGGLLPRYRRIVEKLAQTGLVKVISGTDTLGVGVNIPIRTVLLRQLYKYDGEKTALLSARQFHQISGRAGRKGFDDRGRVVVLAPEWVVENIKLKAKLAAHPHLKKKVKLKKKPPRAIEWDEGRFKKLLGSEPEPLEPQFNVTHGMLVQLLQGDPQASDDSGGAGGYRRLLELIGRAHASEGEKRFHRRRAANLFRSLVDAGIIEIEPSPAGLAVRVQEDLQYDFSLNHTLSVYLVETLELLDPDSPELALDMLSLVEAILENPRVILYKQLDRLKGELVTRLKAEGVEYEERMEQLEKVEHPKPRADFIYETFNAFAQTHPWVGDENIRPKSVAREMYEGMLGFNDYIRDYGLARAEGVLLRYLSQAYKTAVQNVPEGLWTEEFEDILAFLHGLVRRTDSSLLEEWELLFTGPGAAPEEKEPRDRDEPPSPTLSPRAIKARVRNELHVLLKALADRDYDEACAAVSHSEERQWDAEMSEREMRPYFEEHESIDVTPRARLADKTILVEEPDGLTSARQRIIDPEGDEDWTIYAIVDPARPVDPEAPMIELERIGR